MNDDDRTRALLHALDRLPGTVTTWSTPTASTAPRPGSGRPPCGTGRTRTSAGPAASTRASRTPVSSFRVDVPAEAPGAGCPRQRLSNYGDPAAVTTPAPEPRRPGRRRARGCVSGRTASGSRPPCPARLNARPATAAPPAVRRRNLPPQRTTRPGGPASSTTPHHLRAAEQPATAAAARPPGGGPRKPPHTRGAFRDRPGFLPRCPCTRGSSVTIVPLHVRPQERLGSGHRDGDQRADRAQQRNAQRRPSRRRPPETVSTVPSKSAWAGACSSPNCW